MRPKRCAAPWQGPGVGGATEHACARPPAHPAPCMCYCGERPSEDSTIELACRCEFLQHAQDRGERVS